MSEIESVFSPRLSAALNAARDLASLTPSVGDLLDDVLLSEQRGLAELRRSVDSYASALAGEIAHRSRRELGHSGLAQRSGFRTPEALVQFSTGSSSREATTLVRVGALLNGDSPWLADVAAAVSKGDLSAPAAEAISFGLGKPVSTEGTSVTTVDLAAAAGSLLEEARTLTVDELARRARELRDDLDTQGVIDRERAIYEERSLKRTRRPNGLNRYTIDPDIETAAFLDDVYDKLMAPRRNVGPRFIDPSDQAWAEKISTDPRTPEQYLHDSFTELIKQAATAGTADSRRIVGSRMPAVKVLVAAPALESGEGRGHIEGQPLPVSLATVERVACTAGTLPIRFSESGQVLDMGREIRLFNPAQRKALAARDGGCRVKGCTIPASMTEAHHVHPWLRDNGRTDIADGILLCRFHHMLLHNNNWEITRRGDEYWLIPPRDLDPTQTPQEMPSKSGALRDLLAS